MKDSLSADLDSQEDMLNLLVLQDALSFEHLCHI